MKGKPILFYKFASRSRPAKFFEVLDQLHELAMYPNFMILATLDSDDQTMNNQNVREKLMAYSRVGVNWGESRSKIEAINRGMEIAGHCDIIINLSDDMFFLEKGFDVKIIEDMQQHFPDYDGVLHYPDGSEGGRECMTMSIMGRQYLKRFGYFIYHPSYISLWCDNEATEVAQLLGKYRFIDHQLFEHRHPANGFNNNDKQYIHTESFFHIDKATYEKRKALGFDLPDELKKAV